MPLVRLIARLVGDRRGVIVLSLIGLGVTLGAAVLAEGTDTVGPTMLLPWVALFAFEAGAALGVTVAAVAFGAYLAFASADNLAITAQFVTGRLASFVLIGVGVGLAGQKLRRS